jgi:CheY-like chemotaxis protein
MRMLGAADLVANSVASGTDALARMRAAAAAGVPYGLVLLALEMPGMSGLEVAQAVDADPALAGSRIVLLTPFGRQGVETSHPLACVVGMVAKPVRASVLRAGLRSFLGEPSSGAGRPAPGATREARRRRPGLPRRASSSSRTTSTSRPSPHTACARWAIGSTSSARAPRRCRRWRACRTTSC